MQVEVPPLGVEWERGILRTVEREYAPAVRRFSELLPVLMEPGAVKNPDAIAYYMYRGVSLSAHRALFKEYLLRYDITVIPQGKVGKEFVKTHGHYHPIAEHDPLTGKPLSYPEVYEVLTGEALFLLQDREARRFYFARARAGDVVVIPPNYGHVTVNPGKDVLFLANIVSDRFSSEYEPVRERRGFAWYYTEDGWVRNEHYKGVPEPEEIEPKLPLKNIYAAFVDCPKLFDFLNRPSKMEWKRFVPHV